MLSCAQPVVRRGKKLSYGIMRLIRSKYQNMSGIFLQRNSSLFLALRDDVGLYGHQDAELLGL